jgi:hypothetical protein
LALAFLADRNLTTEALKDTEADESNDGEDYGLAFLDLNFFSGQFRDFRG